LTREILQKWLARMAAAPAQNRPTSDGEAQYRRVAESDDEKRSRRASANRVWTMLRAILNHAFVEGHVSSDAVWRRVEPLKDVDAARGRWLTIAEAQRLINASEHGFRELVHAALETGCRYSELCRLKVSDFNPDAGTVSIAKRKSGKARHVVLSDQGAAFFKQQCAGRAGKDVMFEHPRGGPWRDSDQKRPMSVTVARAKISPPIGFHGLRHTWASLAVMAGMPLMLVARNLGHADTGMVERHYGHLAASFVTEGIRAAAPRYDIKPQKKSVVPLR
jgi:integrase